MPEIYIIILAYLIGSVSNATWVSKKFFDIDIRDYGSGNAGATNTFRVLGPRAGTFVLILDMLKGVLAVKLACMLPFYMLPEHVTQLINLQIGLGLSAVVGHIFPIWYDFRGGKGIATLFGMVLAIQPLVALSCVGVFLLMLFLTRYVSLSSILAGIAFPILLIFIFREQELFYKLFAIAIALLVILTHQKNIGRLLKGTENKVPMSKNKRKEEDGEN
ncbi:MAG TPA: glycerol-3-phosphate 1-O-acyltransferase PlsY [Chitinophagaceae bacterium]|jgi:glycerol-3-phosphate acyltransferase PlsY|nr:glycerol-3-phosphate 1-O-acyltransferase PlsY [Chitinophagaceae bacterium]